MSSKAKVLFSGRGKRKYIDNIKNQYINTKSRPVEAESFETIPIPKLCEAVELLIRNLEQRGYPVYDFDNKEKHVQMVRMLGGKVYFMAAEDEDMPERGLNEDRTSNDTTEH